MSKFGITSQKHKNSDNPGTNSSSKGAVYIYAQCPKISAPYLKQFKSYCKKCSFLIHFKTLVLVSLQHNGRCTACISTTTVLLECWWPTTCVWQVERSDHTCVKSIQHQEGNMVATIVGYLGKECFQEIEYVTHLKRQRGPKGPWSSFSGHCRDTRGVNFILEPHWWNLQQYQARRQWVNR